MPVFLCTHVRTHAHYMCKNDMHTRTHTILHTVTITLTPHASKDVLYLWYREPTEEEFSGANKIQKGIKKHLDQQITKSLSSGTTHTYL